MSLVGYARVSSVGQKLDAQIKKLQEAGCEEIYQEKISGIDQNRPALKDCLNYLRKGDTLVITKLDRLARSAIHLGQLVERFQKEKINFIVLDQNIDTTTPTGKLMFHMLSAFAEFENNLRRERQQDGIKSALNKGIKFGRKPKLSKSAIQQVKQDRASGKTVAEIQKTYNIGRATVYRALEGSKTCQS